MFPGHRTTARRGLLLLATATVVGTLGARVWADGQPGPVPAKSISATCPPSKPPRLDLHGDPLPEGAIARLGTVRLRHGHIMSGLAFSGDGKLIIASDYYSGVHVWDVAEGTEVRRCYETDRFCHGLAVSPDGRTLAVALSDLSVRLCDPTTGRELGILTKGRDRVGNLIFSGDGSLLLTGTGSRVVRFWDVATRESVRTVTFPDNVGRIALSSDGKLLAGNVRNDISLWDVAQNQEIRRLKNEDGAHSLGAAFAPRGGPLAVWGYEDASVRLFDPTGAREIRSFSPDRGVAPKVADPWGWASRIVVSFAPDGKTIAIVRDVGRIELWDVDGGKKLHTLAYDSSRRPTMLAFSPDGTKLASAAGDNWGGDNTIRVWDVVRGKELNARAGHGSQISSVAVRPNGTTVATAGQDGIIHLWDGTTGKHLSRLQADPGRRPQVRYSIDGRRLIAWGSYGSDGTLRIWDVGAGQALSRLDLPGAESFWETVSDDGNTGVSVHMKERSVRFHDLRTGKMIQEVADDGHRPIALSPMGDRLVGVDGALMTVADHKEILRITGVHAGNTSVRFSADGRRIAAAVIPARSFNYALSDPPAEEVVIIDQPEGKERRRFGLEGETFRAIDAVALSRDGRTVVTARANPDVRDEQVITLWEAETGRERGHFLGHRGQTQSVAISADGRLVVSGSQDTSGLVWDATRPRTRVSSIRGASAVADVSGRFGDLAGDNAEQAYASMWALVNAPKGTLAYLDGHPQLFAATDVQKIQKWIEDLDGNRYADRERASQELGLVVDEAESHLRKVLAGNPSAEVRRRIDLLLQARSQGATGRELQRLRVLEVLEQIADPGAVAVLTKLAAALGGRLAREAKASLERLEGRADMKR